MKELGRDLALQSFGMAASFLEDTLISEKTLTLASYFPISPHSSELMVLDSLRPVKVSACNRFLKFLAKHIHHLNYQKYVVKAEDPQPQADEQTHHAGNLILLFVQSHSLCSTAASCRI